MRTTVLVTDGEQRAALAVVRSLGRAGYRCIVGSHQGSSLAGGSRYAEREVRLLHAEADPEGYVESVASAAAAEDAQVVLPVTESSLLALLSAPERIPARLPDPPLDVFRRICDKAQVLEAAYGIGIRVPRQQMIREAREAGTVDVPWPVVLKPSRSVYTSADGTRKRTNVRWVYSANKLASALSSYSPEAYPILVQEVISGPGIGIFLFCVNGEVVASFAHRRIREKPPRGGVSVVRRSEPLDPGLLNRSRALLERFNWSGVAMVEYKVDERTGEPVLMEVNGRFWGSLQLAIDAGVDFPRLVVEASLGRPVTPAHHYRMTGSRWFWGDVDHLIAVAREPGIGWRRRFHAFGAWLRDFGPSYREEVFRWNDPIPFFRESVQWASNALRRR